MEKQKIFWVVLSVSVFVVVVLVVGVFLLRQKPTAALASAPGTVNPISDLGAQVFEFSREKTPAEPESGLTETMHFYIGEEGQKPQGEQAVEAPAQAAHETLKIAPAAPAPKSPAARIAARPKPAAAPQRSIDYWIQTGSYKSQTKAEELASTLSSKGLAGRVFSSTVKNETFYRVRIGPYGNRGEADKFLAIVRRIQGLESSYVSQVSTAKNLN